MYSLRINTAFFAVLAIFSSMHSVQAALHLWHVKEVFTNASGSVQFIEMFDSFGGETAVNFSTITANSDGNIKTFRFPNNLTKPTPGSLLIATTGFGSLAGAVAPDFTFDQSSLPVTGPFFNPNATNITITFSGSGDSMTFTGALLPKDGINSLTDSGATGFPPGTPNISAGLNSPTNLGGMSGSVNLSAPTPTGDYNGDHTVNAADFVLWRNTFTQAVSPNGSGADGSGNGTIDAADYDFWKARFGNAVPGLGSALGATAVPEPITPAWIATALCLIAMRRRH